MVLIINSVIVKCQIAFHVFYVAFFSLYLDKRDQRKESYGQLG